MNTNFQGINKLQLDNPNQIEFNRRKNVEQDDKIATLNTQVANLMAQSPAGFIPRVYYGLTLGNNTYRFDNDAEFVINDLPGTTGDSYTIVSHAQLTDYIPAVAIQIDEETIKIQIQGDYPIQGTDYDLVNMRTGASLQNVLAGETSLQTASYLGEVSAGENKNKQITVVNDIELGATNVIFASLDLNSDDVWNWVKIGSYVNGTDGTGIFGITNATISTVLAVAQPGDLLLAGESFTYNEIEFAIGDLNTILTVSPLAVSSKGNIRGPQGATGATGQNGQDGADGLTPTIIDGYWYIGGVSTGVVAVGQDGQNGQDGTAFAMQSGLYSTIDNWGDNDNVGPNGETLLQLPTLPQSNISGKGYIVYDPLTTPLNPYYDLYWANNGDNDWTIIHPFNGINGQNGADGLTPYISGGTWWIGNTNTGVPATGPQGPAGTYTVGNGIDITGDTISNTAVLKGNTAPTTATVGYVGQFYLDTVTTKLYKCDSVNAQGTTPETYTYTWSEVGGGKSLYNHLISLTFPGFNVNAQIVITSTKSTTYTLDELKTYLYNNGYNNEDRGAPLNSQYVSVDTNKITLSVSIFSNNSNIRMYKKIITVDFANAGLSLSTSYSNATGLTDTVAQIL